ncbi:unnamed protein product [Symbiodinium natans]|uniref:Uncharacterized protein n=1 Tax=Symbiodinium natans TaxID=878477 RepID=A0A812KJ66_9DINO|nr:unnamed protein product [Symbiodinium natans]
MQGECTEEMISWIFPSSGGSSSSTPLRPLALWKRQRVLAISLWSLSEGEGFDSRVWHALRLMTDTSQQRVAVEDAFREFIDARGLDKVEVPMWALIQLGRRPDRPPAPGAATDIAAKLHEEACLHMEAVLAAEDPSAVPIDALAAIHKCLHKPTREAFQEILQSRLRDRIKLQKRSGRAATRVLLWELRRAFCERRTPDLALAAHLLESGARTRPREEEDMNSDDDEDPAGHPGGSRYATEYDDAPRNSLDLLALNRFAEPQKLELAIKKAVEFKADPKQNSSYERPLTLAVRCRNVAAVHALLNAGAPVDRQALAALQTVSDRRCRQDMEDRFLSAVTSGGSNLCLKDVAFWVLVQSGNIKAVRKRLKSESSDNAVDAHVMMGLRRCRKKSCTQELHELLVEQWGGPSVSACEVQAATAELMLELREALIDQRGPDEETVSELVALGANVHVRGVDLDIDLEDEEETDDAMDHDSDNDSDGS